MYNKDREERQDNNPASPEDIWEAARIMSFDGCFIPKDIQERWGIKIDRERGKIVFTERPTAKSDS